MIAATAKSDTKIKPVTLKQPATWDPRVLRDDVFSPLTQYVFVPAVPAEPSLAPQPEQFII